MPLHRDIMVQSVCPETSPGPSLLLLHLQAGQKTSGFGKGGPAHSSLVQYQGRITVLAFLARLQLCTSGPDISFAG